MAIQYLDDQPSSTIQYLDDGSSSTVQPTKMGGSPPLGFVASKVMSMTPASKLSALFPQMAGAGAEELGKLGVNPKIAASAMLPVSMAPDILGTIAGAEEIENPSTLTKAITHSPSDLSPEYNAVKEAAGISNNLPETGGRTARFPNLAGQPSKFPPDFAPAIAPINYPRDPNSLINFAQARMQGLGNRLSPQELSDYRTIIGQLIDTGKVGGGQPLAMAAQAKAQATDLLNNQVEGLAELNKVYALSSKLRNPSQFLPQAVQTLIQKYGPSVARGAAYALGGGSVYEGGKKIFGGGK